MVLLKNVFKVSVWSYCLFLLGTFSGALGPTLLDLKHLFQTSLLEISNLFLIIATAEGVGCLCSMAVLKFLDSNLVLLICIFLQGTSIVLFAVTPNLYVAFVAAAVTGVATACCFNCVVYQCNLEFDGKSAIMHGVVISTSVGGVIAPLIAEPFLELQNTFLDVSLTWKNESFQNNIFSPQLSADIPSSTNSSPVSTTSMELGEPYSNDATTYNLTNSSMKDVKSQVHMVYIILGLIHLPVVFGVIALFILERRDNCKDNVSTKSDYTGMGKQEPIHKLTTILFNICLFSVYMSSGGLPYAYGSYLSVYGVESYLHLSPQRMATMTSAFWMLFTLGRILGTILSLYMRQSVLIYTCLIGVLLAAVLVVFLTPLGEMWLWVGSMAIGLFSAPLLAALLSWCTFYIILTPVMIGICTFGDLTGVFLLQYFTGQVMGRVGVDWYLYFIVFLSIFELMTFVILTVLGYYINKIESRS